MKAGDRKEVGRDLWSPLPWRLRHPHPLPHYLFRGAERNDVKSRNGQCESVVPHAARGVHQLVAAKVVNAEVSGFRRGEMQRTGLGVELEIFSADALYGSGSSLLANGDCGWWKLFAAINGEGGGAGRGVGIFCHAEG